MQRPSVWPGPSRQRRRPLQKRRRGPCRTARRGSLPAPCRSRTRSRASRRRPVRRGRRRRACSARGPFRRGKSPCRGRCYRWCSCCLRAIRPGRNPPCRFPSLSFVPPMRGSPWPNGRPDSCHRHVRTYSHVSVRGTQAEKPQTRPPRRIGSPEADLRRRHTVVISIAYGSLQSVRDANDKVRLGCFQCPKQAFHAKRVRRRVIGGDSKRILRGDLE